MSARNFWPPNPGSTVTSTMSTKGRSCSRTEAGVLAMEILPLCQPADGVNHLLWIVIRLKVEGNPVAARLDKIRQILQGDW